MESGRKSMPDRCSCTIRTRYKRFICSHLPAVSNTHLTGQKLTNAFIMNNLQRRGQDGQEQIGTGRDSVSGTAEERIDRSGIDRAPEHDAASEVGTVTAPLTDLTPDDRNANAGTERGRAMVEESLRRYGAGRSILVDRNGNIIAGNTTHEAAIDIGLTDAVIVKTDGRKLVVVQRTDVDLDSPEGRALAVADNRTSEVGLSWDPGVLAALAADEAVDLSALFSEVELADLLRENTPPPKFSPEPPQHRLDELAPNIECPRCGHSWHHGAKS